VFENRLLKRICGQKSVERNCIIIISSITCAPGQIEDQVKEDIMGRASCMYGKGMSTEFGQENLIKTDH
jgi:hypothetical protein